MDNTSNRQWLSELVDSAPGKIILSNVRSKSQEFQKIVITPKLIGGREKYQAEKFTKTQAFHENLDPSALADFISSMLDSDFKQVDSFSDSLEFCVKLSKKGKEFVSRRDKSAKGKNSIDKSATDKNAQENTATDNDSKETGTCDIAAKSTNSEESCTSKKASPKKITMAAEPPNAASHNRRKKRLIEEGTVVEPLIDMGIFTAEGKVVKSMGDKFRQINRFLEIVDDAVDAAGLTELTIVDFGCGKAYLTFILYYYLNMVKGIRATMVGLDLKEDVIRKCNEAAAKYGYDRLHFEVGDISKYTSDKPLDMVITLHACDTATDYALYHAISWKSRIILSVPCCQHELNAQIKSDELSGLTKYGIIKERFAALATDAIRASLLEHEGYKTQVLEFVDLSHTPKNLLIRAVRTNVSSRKRENSLREAEALMEEFGADQTLYRLLKESK